MLKKLIAFNFIVGLVLLAMPVHTASYYKPTETELPKIGVYKIENRGLQDRKKGFTRQKKGVYKT